MMDDEDDNDDDDDDDDDDDTLRKLFDDFGVSEFLVKAERKLFYKIFIILSDSKLGSFD